ncbi:M48 family metallopeptidase [Methanobacterium sp. ACI-7]|uniref:M48 family metallopeptidase n=1 Tax=unclassified Methanobacterium TaxID=2627676 RepID=UPI0039C3EA32
MKTLQIYDLEVKYEIVTRKVKYWRLEIKNGNLILISPPNFSNHQKIIETHREWIYKKLKSFETSKKEASLRELNFERNEEEFKQNVLYFTAKFSNELNVTFNRVYFKKMKSRWGSCSSRKNISINLYLRYLPQNLIEYVIFHEIAHLVELNHSKNFWNIISSKFSNYKDLEKELSIYWLAVKDNENI